MRKVLRIFQNKKTLVLFFPFAVLLVVFLFYCLVFYYNYFQVDLKALKIISEQFLTEEIGTAVSVSSVDLEFPNKIILSDLKISKFQDFSELDLFLYSNRVELIVDSLWAKNIIFKKIHIFNPDIDMDLSSEISDNLLEYLQKVTTKKIELINIKLNLKIRETSIVQTINNFNIRIEKDKKNASILIYDYFYPIPTQRFIRGDLLCNFEKKNVRFNGIFNNFKVNDLTILQSKFTQLKVENGKVSFRAYFFKNNDSQFLEAYSNYSNVNVSWEKILTLKNIHFNNNFIYQSTQKESNRLIYMYNFEKNSIQFEELYKKSKLTNRLIKADLQNLSYFSKHQSNNKVTLNGKVFFKSFLNWEKSEISPVVESDLELSKIEYISDLIQLKIEKGTGSLLKNDQVILDFYGLLFSEKFSLKARGKLKLKKESYNVLNIHTSFFTDLEIQLQIQKLELEKLFPLFENLKSNYLSEVKFQSKKLLKKEKFIFNPFYRRFLREGKYNLESKIEKFALFKNSRDVFPILINSEINGERGKLTFKSLSSQALESNSFVTFYGKEPYLDISLSFNQLGIHDKFISFCGQKIFTNEASLDFKLKTLGNSELELYQYAYFNYHIKLVNNIIKTNKKNKNFPFNVDGFDYSYDYYFSNLSGKKININLNTKDGHYIGNFIKDGQAEQFYLQASNIDNNELKKFENSDKGCKVLK